MSKFLAKVIGKSNHNCCCCDHGCSCHNEEASLKQLIIQFGTASIFFSVGILFIFLFKNLTIASFTHFELTISSVFFIFAWIISGYNVLLNSLKNILSGKIFDENFLMTIATLGAFCIGEWSEGAAVMLFYNLGELVQNSAVEKSRKSIIDLIDLRPDFARIYKPYSEKDKLVDPASVKVGALICVKPGEKIPLDGIVIQGNSTLDTSSMTGESIPRTIQCDEEVLAGFINLTGLLVIRTTKKLENTAVAKMLNLIEEAQNRKAKTERIISSFAKVYTPIVTISAVLIALLPPIFNKVFLGVSLNGFLSFTPWISRGLVFLVISCPCAFIISVPLGYFAGIGYAAKNGILIKSADYIDALSKTCAAVFDKTGTLTNGVLTVSKIVPVKMPYLNTIIKRNDFDIDQENILEFATIAEAHSNHPIAVAICKFAKETFGDAKFKSLFDKPITEYYEVAGKGVSVKIDDKKLFAGTEEFIKEEIEKQYNSKTDYDEVEKYFSNLKNESKIIGTQVHVLYNNNYLGFILLSDALKLESKDTLAQLFSLGVGQIEMLTGDNKSASRIIADELGIAYTANLLPHQKVERFTQIKKILKTKNKKGLVIFIGDGINDAPVLAGADVGIAMGGTGSDAAIEAADVVLINDNPLLIPKAIRISRFTRKIVLQNIGLAFFIKLSFLGLGAFGIADMWGAVFADVGVALLAVLNSLRISKF